MKAKRCPACGREFRVGVHAILANTKSRKIVCGACAARGVVVVAARVAPPARKAPAVTADARIRSAVRELRKLATAHVSNARVWRDDGALHQADVLVARAEGLESAIELLTREAV